MPTKEQVRALLAGGRDYRAAALRLGIPPGQAYMIATGRPADGSDTPSRRASQRDGLLTASQDLANPPHENPTGSESVHEWIAARARADAPMQEAAKKRTAQPAEPLEEDSHEAITVLGRDHNQVRALVQQLEALPSHKTGGSRADVSMRKSIVDMITVRLSQHEAAEEEYLWPAVRSSLADGDQWADGALQQEQEGKDILTALGRLDADTDDFDEHVEQLIAALRGHVAYEERLFLLLREAMPDDERKKLGKRILAAKKKAPTRPHPHAPKKPGAAVKAAGLPAAAMDKARDAAGDRPAKRKGKPE